MSKISIIDIINLQRLIRGWYERKTIYKPLYNDLQKELKLMKIFSIYRKQNNNNFIHSLNKNDKELFAIVQIQRIYRGFIDRLIVDKIRTEFNETCQLILQIESQKTVRSYQRY